MASYFRSGGKSARWLRLNDADRFCNYETLECSDRDFRILMRAAALIARMGTCYPPETLARLFRTQTPIMLRLVERGFLVLNEDNHVGVGPAFSGPPIPGEVRERGRKGWTYLIQRGVDGPVKIGSTLSGVRQRIESLQTAHDVDLVCVGAAEGVHHERRLHQRFADRRLKGEWFAPSVLEEIDFYGVVPEEAA